MVHEGLIKQFLDCITSKHAEPVNTCKDLSASLSMLEHFLLLFKGSSYKEEHLGET